MKKVVLGLTFLFAIAITNVYFTKQDAEASNAILANVEAIADDSEVVVDFPCNSQKFESCKFTARMADGSIVPAWIDGYVNKP